MVMHLLDLMFVLEVKPVHSYLGPRAQQKGEAAPIALQLRLHNCIPHRAIWSQLRESVGSIWFSVSTKIT